MNRTKIEYGTHAWNPVTGCSYGCPWGCWAETCFNRWEAIRKQHGCDDFRLPMIHPLRLNEPLKMKKPARILASFMGDLFGPEIPTGFVDRVFGQMQSAPQHKFFVLTKRAEIMKVFVEHYRMEYLAGFSSAYPREYPHVHLGVSVTTQAEADERIPLLLATPAAKRWVSIEPMLGPIVLEDDWIKHCSEGIHGGYCADAAKERVGVCYISETPCPLSFVVGSIDRPSAQFPAPKREWIESIREQCASAGVPLWEKNNLARHGIVKDRALVQELP